MLSSISIGLSSFKIRLVPYWNVNIEGGDKPIRRLDIRLVPYWNVNIEMKI